MHNTMGEDGDWGDLVNGDNERDSGEDRALRARAAAARRIRADTQRGLDAIGRANRIDEARLRATLREVA